MDTNPSTGCLLRRIDLAGEAVSFVAGTSGLCFAFALDGTGASARFGAVGGMAMGPEPFLYITDTFKIRRVNVDTGLVETIAGSSEGFANGIGTAAQFATLGEIAVGPSNDLYIADRGNSMIRRLDLATNDVTTVTVTGGIEFPRALAITGSTIAVAEQPAHTLRVGDVSTTPLSLPVVAGASGARGTSDGSGVSALLDRPVGLGVGTGASSLELLYVAEQQTGLTRVIDLGVPANTVSTFPISGTRASGIASSGGRLYVTMEQSGQRLLQEINPTTGAGISAAVITATAARGVAVVGGHAYVATANEATIRRIDIDPALGSDELFAGQTNQRATGDGDVNSARFGDPTQIVACGGDLYISDSTDLFIANIIRKIDLDTTIVSTVAGAPTAVGAEDGIGAAARFNTPEGIACDGTSLYVADSKNHIVRQIELATNRVTTLAGIPHRSGAIDGVGTDARFNEPFGLTYDPTTGDLFVTDASEHVVRRIH
jgi:streptogramin lyase